MVYISQRSWPISANFGLHWQRPIIFYWYHPILVDVGCDILKLLESPKFKFFIYILFIFGKVEKRNQFSQHFKFCKSIQKKSYSSISSSNGLYWQTSCWQQFYPSETKIPFNAITWLTTVWSTETEKLYKTFIIM